MRAARGRISTLVQVSERQGLISARLDPGKPSERRQGEMESIPSLACTSRRSTTFCNPSPRSWRAICSATSRWMPARRILVDIDVRICAFDRPFRESRKLVGGRCPQRVHLRSAQAHQLGCCTRIVSSTFPAAPVAAFWRSPERWRRAGHRLRPERTAGAQTLAPIEPMNGA